MIPGICEHRTNKLFIYRVEQKQNQTNLVDRRMVIRVIDKVTNNHHPTTKTCPNDMMSICYQLDFNKDIPIS